MKFYTAIIIIRCCRFNRTTWYGSVKCS